MKKVEITAYGAPEQVAHCVEAPDVGSPGPGEIVFARSDDYGQTWQSDFTVGTNVSNLSNVAPSQQLTYIPTLNDDDGGLYFIFGGKRSGIDHPTHACPAYKMAIGVMLGMLAGLLGSTRLRPTMSPMQLEVSRR